MSDGAIILGASVALELIRFIRTTKNLANYTDEQILEMWTNTNENAKLAFDRWQQAKEVAAAKSKVKGS